MMVLGIEVDDANDWHFEPCVSRPAHHIVMLIQSLQYVRVLCYIVSDLFIRVNVSSIIRYGQAENNRTTIMQWYTRIFPELSCIVFTRFEFGASTASFISSFIPTLCWISGFWVYDMRGIRWVIRSSFAWLRFLLRGSSCVGRLLPKYALHAAVHISETIWRIHQCNHTGNWTSMPTN
jgi:hypothetical protein